MLRQRKIRPQKLTDEVQSGCGKSICEACNTDTTSGRCNLFDWCDCCDGTWCKDCTPGTFRCSCCQSSHCKDCMRYGCDGSPIKDYHCCGSYACEVRWCDDCVERGADGICICSSEGCGNISCGNCAADFEFFICPFCEDMRSAKSVFRVPAKTARSSRKDFSPTKRTTMMCMTYVTVGRPVPE